MAPQWGERQRRNGVDGTDGGDSPTDAGDGGDSGASSFRSVPEGETVPTTLLLERDGDDWRVTQRGVDAVGEASDPALAAARYCRQVSAVASGGDDSQADGTLPVGASSE